MFYNFYRMTHESFRKLLELVYDQLRHADTNMRLSITPAEKLAVTLRYVLMYNSHILKLHKEFRQLAMEF